MTRRMRMGLAAGVSILTGLVTLGLVVALTGQTWLAHRQTQADRALLDDLRERGRKDNALAVSLHTEYDEQTDAELARTNRARVLGWWLVASAGCCLLSTKWGLKLRQAQAVVPTAVLAQYERACAAVCSSGGLESATPTVVTPPGVLPLPVIEPLDLTSVDEIIARHGDGPEAVIPILQALQVQYRYLPQPALRRVCERTAITPAQITGVASFYTQFRHTPTGEHVVTVCHGTACHVAGAQRITDQLRHDLNIPADQDTDAGGNFTVQAVPCLGCCTLAPVIQVDGQTHGHTAADAATSIAREMVARRSNGKSVKPATMRSGSQDAAPSEIRLGMGSCCVANGSGGVYDALQDALNTDGLAAHVKRVGCVGMCHQTPFIEVVTPGSEPKIYTRIQPEHVRRIVRRHFKPNGIAGRLRAVADGALDLYRNGNARRQFAEHTVELRDPPVAAFLDRQKHIATEHYGRLDPLDLDEYLALEGFETLKRCRAELSPDEIINHVRRSGLRGRGGGGFPTGEKWSKVRQAAGTPKYIICNGDEGDPGAFMDRMLMESYPYRLLEGMAIAALATGATEGVLYIRAEYPLAVERITEALQRCEERRLIGKAQGLTLRVVQGAGAFVCGEETALIASLEGRRGVPELRPPYPAERGLRDRPTLVGNVETFTVVPWILRNGPDAFAALGTPASKGTKVFALTGKTARGGLIEVPMGITIREIVEDIGGGVKVETTGAGPRQHTFKAVQIGGPSGGCLPASLAETPIDFDALHEAGAMMGSGGLVVLDETDCMVDIARYFLSFTQDQSCGLCAPCRVGTRRLLEILDRLCGGQARPDDLETLEHLARMVGAGSLCGLGKTAPNPVLTSLRYFREEYEAHVAGRCPAGRCKALVQYAVTDQCTGCTLCAQHCPAGAIELRPYQRHEIDTEKCTRCDGCRSRCPEGAIEIASDGVTATRYGAPTCPA